MNGSHDTLLVSPTDDKFPGLFDVVLPDGRVISDVTRGQVLSIAGQHNLDIEVNQKRGNL